MLDDCLAGFTWARSRSRSPVVVLGGSAGGALALGVAYRLGLAGRGDEVAGVVALYPVAVHPARLPGRWEGVHASFGELEGTAPLVRGVDQLDVLGGFLFVSFFPSFPRLWSTHLHPLFFFFPRPMRRIVCRHGITLLFLLADLLRFVFLSHFSD